MTKTRSSFPQATRPAQPATGAAAGVVECDAATLAAVGDVLFQLLWILCEATAMRTPRLLRPVVLAWMRWKLRRSVRASLRAPVSERDLEEEYEAEEILPEGGLRPARAAQARTPRGKGHVAGEDRREEDCSGEGGGEQTGVTGSLAGRGWGFPVQVGRDRIGSSHARGQRARAPPGGFLAKTTG